MTTPLEKIQQELKQMPPEYLPALFNIIHTFRESVQLNPAAQSFQQGFTEALNGETYPIETLWDDMDA